MNNPESNSKIERTAEIIAGLFYDMLKTAGVAFNSPVNSHERLRDIARKLAATIEHSAQQKAVETVKLLQTAVSKAFKLMESDFEVRNDHMRQHKAQLDKLESEMRKLEARVEHIVKDQQEQNTGPKESV